MRIRKKHTGGASPVTHNTPTKRRTLTRIGAGLATFGLLAGAGATLGTVAETVSAVSPAVKAPSASAADYSKGFNAPGDEAFGGTLGSAALPDGTLTYCVHPKTGDMTGASTGGAVQGYVDYNGNPLPVAGNEQLDWAFSVPGQVHDLITDEATSLLSYSWTGSYDAAHPLGSEALGLKYLSTSSPNYAAIAAKYDQLWNQMQDPSLYATGPTTGSGTVIFNHVPGNPFLYTATMQGTPGSTGSLVLTHATFQGTNSNVATGVAEGQTLTVVQDGTTQPNGKLTVVSATGSFTPPGGGYGPGFAVWQNGGGQDSGAPGTKIVPGPFQVAGFDPAPLLAPSMTTTAHPAEVVGGTTYDKFTYANTIADTPATITITFWPNMTCTGKPLYTYTTTTTGTSGSGMTDEVPVQAAWVNPATGQTSAPWTETIAVAKYNFSHTSQCGQPNEITVLSAPKAPTPVAPSTPAVPSTPAAAPATPADLPVVAG